MPVKNNQSCNLHHSSRDKTFFEPSYSFTNDEFPQQTVQPVRTLRIKTGIPRLHNKVSHRTKGKTKTTNTGCFLTLALPSRTNEQTIKITGYISNA